MKIKTYIINRPSGRIIIEYVTEEDLAAELKEMKLKDFSSPNKNVR